MIAVAAESPGAASVVNAVLLNAVLSKVHEATGAEESCAVGLPRSVVRCLFEASVFPAVLAYARDVAVRWRSRTFSSLAGATSAVSLVGVLLGLGVRAIDGLAACDEVAGDKTVIDETFARALCDVGVECEDSICRQLAFEALAATGVFRGDGGEIRRIVLESGRAGMCGGTSEGERDAAAMCAIPFEADADDAGDTPTSTTGRRRSSRSGCSAPRRSPAATPPSRPWTLTPSRDASPSRDTSRLAAAGSRAGS